MAARADAESQIQEPRSASRPQGLGHFPVPGVCFFMRRAKDHALGTRLAQALS
jgi:hypothetical protein